MKHIRRATRHAARRIAASMVILFMLLQIVAPTILLAPNTAIADDSITPVEEVMAEPAAAESDPIEESADIPVVEEESESAEESADVSTVEEPALPPGEEPTVPAEPVEASATEDETIIETPAAEAIGTSVTEETSVEPTVSADESGSGDIPDEPTVEAEGEASVEKIEGSLPIEGVSAPVSENILTNTDATGSVCVGDSGSVLGNASPVWDTDGETAETVAPVALGVEYVFPLDTDVRVVFTCLPKNTALRAPLRIHQVSTDAIRLPEGIYPAGDHVYDITTDMKNGTFEYTLTLPKGDAGDAGISYVEKDLIDAVADGIDADDVKRVDKVDQESGSVTASGIDHFTVYFSTVATYSGPSFSTLKTSYQQGETVYIKASNLHHSRHYRFGINPPGLGNIAFISGCLHGASSQTDTYDLSASASLGGWEAILYEFHSAGSCNGGNPNGSREDTADFTVVAPTGSILVHKLIDGDLDGVFDGTDQQANALGIRWGLDGGSANRYMGSPATGISVGNHALRENSVSDYRFTGAYVAGSGHDCGHPQFTDLPVSIAVSSGQTTEVTLCNERVSGTVTVLKRLFPASDTGLFDLRIDGVTKAEDVSNDGTTDAVRVPTGWHTIAEVAGSDTSLADYDASVSCSNHAWSSGSSIGVFVGSGQHIVCTITNKREGSITVVKDARPDGEKVFTFWKLGHPSFGLNDNGTDEDGYSDRKTFSGLRAGIPYLFGETTPGSGWTLENISCTGGEDIWTSLFHRKAMVMLGPGENVICTFTNVAPGKIIVHKETLPDGSEQSFDFELNAVSGDVEADVVRSEDMKEIVSESPESFSLSDGQSHESRGLSSGRYSVSEAALPEWDLSSAVCDDGSNADDISVEPGETVTCTFTNAKRGVITMKKSLGFESDQTFTFDSSYAGRFVLGPEQSLSVGSLLPGSYSISEEDLYGWKGTGFTCIDNLQNSTFSISGSSVTMNLAPGGDVLCVSSSKDTKRDDDPWDGNGGTGGGGTVGTPGPAVAVGAPSGSGTEAVSPEETEEPVPVGQVEGAEESGLVQGEESCAGGWPLWAWVLLMAAFGGLYNLKKISKSRHVLRWGRVVQGGSLAATLIVWYVFDVCREYWPEVPVVVALIAVISFLYRGQSEDSEA